MNSLIPRKLLALTAVAGWLLLSAGCSREPDPLITGKFTDSRDQKEYRWVKIGTQTWMSENLAYLPEVSPPSSGQDTSKYYYVFRYDGTDVEAAKKWEYYATYGVFYNWPAAMDGSDTSDLHAKGVRGICPDGWHLPSDAEWDVMVNFLGGEYFAGKPLKSTKGWSSYEGEPGSGDNSSGFNGLPAGSRTIAGGFYSLGFTALFWSSTGFNENAAWYRYLGYFHNGVYRYYGNKRYGFSVRCVRDD